eukprot:333709_1
METQPTVSILKLANSNLLEGLDVENLPIGRTSKYISYLDTYNVPQMIILFFYVRDLQLVNKKKNDYMAYKEYKERYEHMTPQQLLIRNLMNNVRFLGTNLCFKYMITGLFKITKPDIITPKRIDYANYFVLLSYVFINLSDIVIYFFQQNNPDFSKQQLIQYYLKAKK